MDDPGQASYRRFLEGDESAMYELVERYNDGLVLYLCGFVNSLSVADELAEDAFVKLCLKRPRHRGLSPFKTWLYAIGRNLAIDYLRRAAREKHVPLHEASLAGSELLESRYLREERKIQVHRAMGRLKPEYRQTLWLLYFEEMSGKEAAKIMRRSVHAVEALAYRARRALREELHREGITDEDI